MFRNIHSIGVGLLLLLFLTNGNSEKLDGHHAGMNFHIYESCRSGTGRGCPTQILLSGSIEHDSASKLQIFLQKKFWKAGYDIQNLVFIFDSPGGSVTGGMALGSFIRDTGIPTEVAREYSYYDEKTHGDNWSGTVLIKKPVCASACVLAFVGGATRSVEPGAMLGVHQFASEKGDLGESNTQKITAMLSSYFRRLGVDRRLLDVASITPAEKMHWLTHEQAVDLLADTSGLNQPIEMVVSADKGGKPKLIGISRRPSGDFYIIMSFVQGHILVALIDGYFVDSKRPVPDASNAEEVQLSFCDGWEQCVYPQPISRWNYHRNQEVASLEAGAILTLDQAVNISKYPNLIYRDGKPMVSSDFSKNLSISSDGLSEKIQLLIRSK